MRSLRGLVRLALAVFFGLVGWLHLARPEPFLQIMPPYLPWHRELVLGSGVCEILGGVGLLVPRLARTAAWGLVALLVAVFPANVYMATDHIQVNGFPAEPWMAWARLPFQVLFIALCLWCTRPERPAAGG
ncbi:DoxX family membrane protein [bacterium CPR1]|nr:DoxX family membrane protein [bacterium CPR1]